METIESKFFKHYRPDFVRLEAFGFRKSGEEYLWSSPFLDGAFLAELTIHEDGNVSGRVLDADTEEEYLPIRNRMQFGGFVGAVRDAYDDLLAEVADGAFRPVDFVLEQSNRIAGLIREVYGDAPEFPWEKYPGNAIFRHQQNEKWYAALLTVDKGKLEGTRESLGEVEVLNLKMPTEEIPELTKRPGIYTAWHMNKKHWISVILDDTLEDQPVMELVARSHSLTAGGKGSGKKVQGDSWIIPANPKYYDVAAGFAGGRTIWWHQHTAVKTGDTVFIYYGVPYSAIMFRCRVLEAGVPLEGTDLRPDEIKPSHKQFMRLALMETYPKDRYPLSFMKAHGGSAIRSARRLPAELENAMEGSPR